MANNEMNRSQTPPLTALSFQEYRLLSLPVFNLLSPNDFAMDPPSVTPEVRPLAVSQSAINNHPQGFQIEDLPVNSCHLYLNRQLPVVEHNGRNVRIGLFSVFNEIVCEAPITGSLVLNSDLDNNALGEHFFNQYINQHYANANIQDSDRNNNAVSGELHQSEQVPEAMDESDPIAEPQSAEPESPNPPNTEPEHFSNNHHLLRILTIVHQESNNFSVRLDSVQIETTQEHGEGERPTVRETFLRSAEAEEEENEGSESDESDQMPGRSRAPKDVFTPQEILALQRNAHAAREAFLSFRSTIEGLYTQDTSSDSQY